jgi:Protein of unknown function (DUF4236)
MGFRFRKRIRLGKGIWINLSKKGGSLSVGGRGATMNVSKKGVRDTFSAPGTGTSYIRVDPKASVSSVLPSCPLCEISLPLFFSALSFRIGQL